MIRQQQTLVLSPYAALYDIVVPKDNMLHQINELVDFTFIYEELEEKYCLVNGRNAIDPIRLFKYWKLNIVPLRNRRRTRNLFNWDRNEALGGKT